ncbi:hypothetical protein OAN13_02325 [Opitutales bacterium]|nr:hypothetical protein [Opitutales bacterium]
MKFTTETPEVKEIKLPAQVTVRDADVTIEIRPDGSPFKMTGRLNGDNVYLWMSALERGKIVTYHLTGKLSANHASSGEFSLFGSHEKAADGKWSLEKNK